MCIWRSPSTVRLVSTLYTLLIIIVSDLGEESLPCVNACVRLLAFFLIKETAVNLLA